MSTEAQETEAEEMPPAEEWPRVVVLKHPIDFAKRRIESLTFRRGKLGDIKGMTVGVLPPVDQLLTLASRMCNEPPKVLEMLDGEDGEEVMEIALVFFAKCLPALGRR